MDDDKIVFTTLQSKRTDAGSYKVVAQNRHGKDTAKLNVRVLDAPGKPTGPIMFTELTGDAASLHWSPPKDDGGAPVTNYVVERRTTGTFSGNFLEKIPKFPLGASDDAWERVGAPAGLQLRVRGLTNGQRYDFRVRAENQYGVGAPLDADEALLSKPPFDVPSAPGAPEPTHTGYESISLAWTRPLRDGGAPITGYVLEKRDTSLAGMPWERAAFGSLPDTRAKVRLLS